MNWYVVHTKPRQEKRAAQHLLQQGYECYLPTLRVEKCSRGHVIAVDEPLFPRYLFVRSTRAGTLNTLAPIFSTRGVSSLVSFGNELAKVSDMLIATIKDQEASMRESGEVRRLLEPGERVLLINGAFVGVEAIYQMADAENRAMVLIELLTRPVILSVSRSELRRAS